MTTNALLVVAVVVFVLMVTGLFYSMNEFIESSDDPSIAKGEGKSPNSGP